MANPNQSKSKEFWSNAALYGVIFTVIFSLVYFFRVRPQQRDDSIRTGYDEAISTLQNIQGTRGSTREGLSDENLQSLDVARKAVVAYIARFPQDANAEIYLGRIATLQHDNDEAISAYEEAIRLKPDYLTPYEDLGILYSHIALPDEAIEPLRHAIQLKPEDCHLYTWLGSAYSEVNSWEQALGTYSKCLEVCPGYDVCQNGLKRAKRKLGGF